MRTLITLTIAFILTANAAIAQDGTMKFSGMIVDENNETQLTLITLYIMNSGSGEGKLIAGQDVIQGNEWFDVQLELGQEYELKVLSNNGEERILAINTTTPKDIDKSRFRQSVKIDITGATLKIDHSFKNQAESRMAYTDSRTIGTISYSDKAEAFIHDNATDQEMPLAASK